MIIIINVIFIIIIIIIIFITIIMKTLYIIGFQVPQKMPAVQKAFWGMVDWYNELISDSSMGPRNCGFRVELRLENQDLQSLTPQLTGFRERFFRHVRTRFVPLDQYCRQLRAFLLLFIERGGLTKRCRDNLLTAHQKKAYCALMLVCGLFFQKQHDYLHAGVAFGQAPNPWGNMPLPDGYQDGTAFMSTSDNPYDDLELLDEATLNGFIIETNNRQVRGPLGLPGDPLQAGVLRRRRLPVAPVLPPAASVGPHAPLQFAGGRSVVGNVIDAARWGSDGVLAAVRLGAAYGRGGGGGYGLVRPQATAGLARRAVGAGVARAVNRGTNM